MATAQEIFQAIESSLSDAAKADELADSFKGSALFYIKDKDLHYFLDLTQTSAEEAHRSRVVSGADASLRKEDASLLVTLNEETLIKLVSGALSPQLAFMTGKLKLKVRLSMREHAPDVSMSLSLSLSICVCVCVHGCMRADTTTMRQKPKETERKREREKIVVFSHNEVRYCVRCCG